VRQDALYIDKHLLIIKHGLIAIRHLFKLFDLQSDETVLLNHLLLDFLKKHVDSLLLGDLEILHGAQESVLVLRLHNFHFELLAFVQDVSIIHTGY
jgi:hypothetical protein